MGGGLSGRPRTPAWLLRHEDITAPLVGAYSPEKLTTNRDVADVDLTDDQFRRLAGARAPRVGGTGTHAATTHTTDVFDPSDG